MAVHRMEGIGAVTVVFARQDSRAIAATGLLLVLFLVLHLGGVVLAAINPAMFDAYATTLHNQPWLTLLEFALAAVAIVHLLLTAAKVIANRQAGNAAVLVSRRRDPLAALAARAAPISGTLLLGFVVVHLLQLRWPRPAVGQDFARLMEVLGAPWVLALYALAGVATGLHLFHGGEAAHRSLGLLDPTNGAKIRSVSRAVALTVGGGFALLPLVLAIGGQP